MTFGEIARGLEQLQVGALTGSETTPSTWVEVPGPRSLTFNTESDSDELEGGNRIIAKVQNPSSLSGSIELGYVNLAALAVLLGSTVETEGTTPDQIVRLEQSDNPGTNYYQIVGQAPAVDQAGAAYRVTILKALTTSGPDETLETNAWNTPGIDFEGLPVDGVLVVREQFETAEDLPPA